MVELTFGKTQSLPRPILPQPLLTQSACVLWSPDDLFTWNTWMYSRRREAPLGLLSWGSNPYPYAPDGSDSALRGTGGGGANLESGLDNGPVMEGVPFNVSGLYLQDEYDAGYTGERNLCHRTTLHLDRPQHLDRAQHCYGLPTCHSLKSNAGNATLLVVVH